MTRLRVLFLISVIDESTCGGAERFAAALASELARCGVEVTVCATRYLSDEFRNRLDAAGVRTIALGRRRKWDVHRIWRLRKILRESGVEVLHSHMFGSNFWGAIYGRLSGVPVVIAHEHTWAYQGNAVRRILDGRFIGRLVDIFVAVSNDDARRMRDYEKVPAAKIRVLPTASVSARETTPPWNIREVLALPRDAKIVAVAAMMRPQKALHILVAAFALVVERSPLAHLVLVGDGECRSALENLTSELGLSRNVHFMGVRDNVVGLLREADCAALSSDFEGMPLFVLESLAAGTRVVATDVGAIGSLIRDGDTGYLVPPRQPVDLSEAILRVLDIPTDTARVRTACSAAVTHLTVECVAEQFAALYADALDNKLTKGN